MRRVSALILILAPLIINCLTLPLPVRAEATLRQPNSRRSTTTPARPDRPTPASDAVNSTEAEEFHYRLIVSGSSDRLLRQVRQVVPDAFRATLAGRSVIQAGLFAAREEAEAVQRQLEDLDLEGSILELDQPILRRAPSRVSSGQPAAFNYRLIVSGSSDRLLGQVRQVVPDAFRTTIAGRSVIQAGLFVERQEAEDTQRQLSRISAETSIVAVDYGITSQPRVTSSQPVRDGRILVVVDPGHGGRDVGAVGIGGIHEADIVLSVAQEVAARLEEQGIQAVLSRQDDREIDLEPRVRLAESVNADLFVSIHANSINLSRPDVNGIETYYYSDGAALASAIHNSLVNATGMNDRGVRQARFYVLTRTSMPAVLVEIGFVTGREDAAKLTSSTARNQIAEGIVQGILRYVRQRN